MDGATLISGCLYGGSYGSPSSISECGRNNAVITSQRMGISTAGTVLTVYTYVPYAQPDNAISKTVTGGGRYVSKVERQ